jgi:hypothetical protein
VTHLDTLLTASTKHNFLADALTATLTNSEQPCCRAAAQQQHQRLPDLRCSGAGPSEQQCKFRNVPRMAFFLGPHGRTLVRWSYASSRSRVPNQYMYAMHTAGARPSPAVQCTYTLAGQRTHAQGLGRVLGRCLGLRSTVLWQVHRQGERCVLCTGAAAAAAAGQSNLHSAVMPAATRPAV